MYVSIINFYPILFIAFVESLPNFVIFLADDLGMGDVGCFGNDTINTPNIDYIADNGAKLTHHIAAASVCSPSRAALLTGKYPIKMGMVPSTIVRVNIFTASSSGLPSEEITFAEALKEKGYSTAIIGKWHLGLHCASLSDFCHHPMKQGFDKFYGIPLTNLKDYGKNNGRVFSTYVPNFSEISIYSFISCLIACFLLYSLKFSYLIIISLLILFLSSYGLFTFVFYNLHLLNGLLMNNFTVVEQPIDLYNNMTQRLVNHAVRFIDESKRNEKPFLLYIPWIQVHTALHTASSFKGRSKHGFYGDNVEELDWGVGEILNSLRNNDLDSNTFIYFSSDNGAHFEETDINGNIAGGWNGIYKGTKTQGGMEGGIRVPTVAMMPGVIPSKLEISAATSNMDLFPTIAELSQIEINHAIDGKSMLRNLMNHSKDATHEFLFHYCGTDIHAVRYSPMGSRDIWKLHLATANWLEGKQHCGYICPCYGKQITWHDPPLLYNLALDPSENTLLSVKVEKHLEVVKLMQKATEDHTHSILPVENQYDIPKIVPRPWLQHCCNFPYCSCKE